MIAYMQLPSYLYRLRSAFIQHLRSIIALLLRDIKTRAGSSYLSFCVGLAIPLCHVAIVMVLYIAMGRRAALGTDVSIYLSTAIIPFVVWSYTHQKIVYSFSQNFPLLSFPIIKIEDIIIARSIAEALNSTLIVTVSATAITLLSDYYSVNDYYTVVFTLILAYLYGVSTGFIVGLVGLLIPGFLLVGFLLIPIMWITCGVFFVPDYLPVQMKTVLEFFPLTHIVDALRIGFYSNYISSFANLNYVYTIITLNVFFGLAIRHIFRTKLSAH